MGIWDKVQGELNRAGKAAQDALDEGRLRLEIFRVRQLADKAAQALGYAAYRAKEKGEEMEAAAWDRLERRPLAGGLETRDAPVVSRAADGAMFVVPLAAWHARHVAGQRPERHEGVPGARRSDSPGHARAG